MKFKPRVDKINKDLEEMKCEIWDLLDDLEKNNMPVPFDKSIRSSMNNLLDYIESIELDSELNPDGN